MLWINMAIRLVPLATLAGNPRNMRMEREMMEPPPARVFINPTRIPETTSNIISIHDIGQI
jgi:hypothetical protein